MNFDIEEIKELSGDAASIYSVTMEGEENTLLEQFFEENAEYDEELTEILNKLYVMGKKPDVDGTTLSTTRVVLVMGCLF